jgi:phage gpG-like protein
MMNVNPAALADEATTTSNMPYTLAMQKGLPQRPGMVIAYFRKNGVHVKTHGTTLPKVPARPFMVLNDDDKKSIDLIALRVLQGRLGGSNGG